MSDPTNIAFIGARGAGKSKLSRKFGKRSGRVVLSTDSLVSYEAGGRTVAQIVAAEGWPGFRDREYELLAKIGDMRDIVVDCGGGILVEAGGPDAPAGAEIFSERKAAKLKEIAHVVYIYRDIDWLIGRVAEDSNRPDLGGDYRRLLERRLPWYERIADTTLDMDGREIDYGLEALARRFDPAD
ncbi:MAG: shikimate kinase [Leptospirales bacterium]|jgi:shikimate kinase